MKWSYIGAIVVGAYFLFPLYVLFLLAFNSPTFTILARYPALLPISLTLNNLVVSLQGSAFIDPLVKSLETATLVGVITLVLAVPAGYGLSRLPRAIAYPILVLLLVTNMMPAIVIGIPIAVEFIKLHLFESVEGLALAQTLITLPLATFILQGTFSSIPSDLENQARVDGAGLLRRLFSILLPIAAPGIAAAFLISWMFSWDEFTYAILLIPYHSTLPVTIYSDVTRGNLLAGVAFSLVFTIPVIVLTFALQKYLRGEYLAGGIKA
ncbi:MULTISPECIES: carbohydrate ABC transporter permease [Metallosphaera]|uniref:carbohydrate ABC transporter permease n=1 Tax=Metallosphaera TaxID=41980 RepID=UPI001F062C7A|nr:carbohydrate ABC transporter permease [Metallosphaera sedula]MCH1770337.1 carbohydrate ABC transporter permease [Metallosphaera sedula]MCP6727829.1 carbohydrate ABC transporter permease [Metallosphaera sedula]